MVRAVACGGVVVGRGGTWCWVLVSVVACGGVLRRVKVCGDGARFRRVSVECGGDDVWWCVAAPWDVVGVW